MITYNIDRYVYIVYEYYPHSTLNSDVLCVTEDFEHAEKYLIENYDSKFIGEYDGSLHYISLDKEDHKKDKYFRIQFEFIYDEVED